MQVDSETLIGLEGTFLQLTRALEDSGASVSSPFSWAQVHQLIPSPRCCFTLVWKWPEISGMERQLAPAKRVWNFLPTHILRNHMFCAKRPGVFPKDRSRTSEDTME